MSEYILATSPLESFIQLIGSLLIFAFVLFVVYLVTKWMGGYQKTHANGKNLKCIEMIPVGNGKLIALIQAGKKFLVVSIGKEEVRFLAELSEDELTDASFMGGGESAAGTKESFQQIFEKMKTRRNKK